MKVVQVQEAVGMVLGHDLTQIIPGKFKGAAFRKGHIIQFEDIPRLLSMGKEHIYVFDLPEGFIHESDAALRLGKAVAGKGVLLTEPKEGKVSLLADETGLLKIDTDKLYEVNEVEQIILATLHTNQVVTKGKKLAETKVIPLVIDEEKIRTIENLCQKPVVEVVPLRPMKVGLVVTGSEVYHGRIQDAFGPVITEKLESLGSTVLRKKYALDDVEMIVDSIKSLIAEGVDMIMVTGGMSVDPDDVTPTSIKTAGGNIVTYGAPTLPGAMFMLAYIGEIPVMGLPGCVMYSKTTIFDLVLPRILAGEKLTRKDIIKMGHGGLCLSCPECRFPDCSFGKSF